MKRDELGQIPDLQAGCRPDTVRQRRVLRRFGLSLLLIIAAALLISAWAY